MRITRRPGVRLAVIAVLLSVAALAPGRVVAAACSGNSHTMTLSDGTVSPGSGTTSTDFSFTVVYTDNAGCLPDRIVVSIPGVGEFSLSHRKGDLGSGATFGRTMSLPVGVWQYRFEATSGNGPGLRTETFTEVDPAKVRVTAPTPRPTSEPSPTPAPTPEPGPATPEPSPDRPDRTAPPHTPRPTDPDTTPSGHDTRTPEPAAAAVLPGSGPGGPADDSDQGITGPSGSTVLEALPRPALALIVSTAGTILGLVVYALLATRLLVPGPRRRASVDPAGPARSFR